MAVFQNYGVIVDGYSSGGEFASVFKKFNIQCVHVQSNPVIPPIYVHSFKPQDYAQKLIYNNDILKLVKELKKYNPVFVITGSEPGVELADQISDYFPVPKNTIALSAARRNKYLMTEQIKLNGLDSIKQFKSSQKEQIIQWAQKAKWPLVIKPLRSSGGDDVKVCHNIDEVSMSFDNMINKKNMVGLINEEALIQEFVDGEEYVVNTVSFSGTPYFCELWRYKRIRLRNEIVYDTAYLIEYDEAAHKLLVEYAIQVADSLGIQYGPMHAEILLGKRPTLVEAAARCMGGNLPVQLMYEALGGRSQSKMTMLAYADPKKFQEMVRKPYQLLKHATAFFMFSHRSGRLRRINYLDEIKLLPSFYGMKLILKPGDQIHQTRDYQTSPGMIYLSHRDKSAIEKDCETIRNLENSNMYEID